MMRLSRNTLLAALLALGTTAAAQNTTKLSASKANDFGIVYNLPYTVLDITVETEYTQRAPGEFSNFARRYLDITDAVTAPSTQMDVRSAVISTRGVPDMENSWLMTFKGAYLTYVLLDDAGVPVAINTEETEAPTAPVLPVAQAPAPTALETSAARHAVTQEMTQSTSTAKRAQLAAQRIFELRENRGDLISGQADNTPPDGQSMQLALDNLEAQEAALTAMFGGTEKRWTTVQTVPFTPDNTGIKNLVVCRISPQKGVVSADDLSGEPLYLTMEVLTEGKLPNDAKGQPMKFPKDGVAYTIPGTAQITLTFRGRTVASQQVSLAQLGVQYGLDPKIFTDKKAPAFATFDPATGALISVGTLTVE